MLLTLLRTEPARSIQMYVLQRTVIRFVFISFLWRAQLCNPVGKGI